MVDRLGEREGCPRRPLGPWGGKDATHMPSNRGAEIIQRGRRSREALQLMIDAYGEPHEATA